ncbi:hypothetical protein [Thioclava sp. JE_KL1]|uniref:ferritin-like domain-containing protein n=1 Tax=Thioclava sp. JE_KL1 TaxID=2651187 RepID=UPI001C12A335|nr:hypothetical protein [Thioclava sp. JE_KL1]
MRFHSSLGTRLGAIVAVIAVVAGTALPAHAALTSAEHRAVLAALDDEYHAQATYRAIMERFGAVRPFSNIERAEISHAAALIGVLRQNGLPVPANPYLSGAKPLAPVPGTLAEACALGVQAEMANSGLYDGRLLPAVAGNGQLTQILTRLRDASQNKHLPAFQRCGGGGQMQGRGMGGQGRGYGGGRGPAWN